MRFARPSGVKGLGNARQAYAQARARMRACVRAGVRASIRVHAKTSPISVPAPATAPIPTPGQVKPGSTIMAIILTVTPTVKSLCGQLNDPVRYRQHTQPAHSRDGLHRPIRGSHLRVPPPPTTESPADISPTYNTPLPTPGPRHSTTLNLPAGLKRLIRTTLHRKSHQSQLQRPSPSGLACYTTSNPGKRGSQGPFADTNGMIASETRSQLCPLNNRVLNLLTHTHTHTPPGGA